MDTDAGLRLSLSISSLTELQKRQTGHSSTFNLPMTARNRRIMGDCDEITGTTLFNSREHRARIEQDGCVVMEGTLYLLASVREGRGGGHYTAAIIGPGKDWLAKAGATPLRKMEIDFTETISAAMIAQSWTWDKPVRFLPVMRDSFAVENYKSHLFPPVKVLSFEDYHPFLHIRTMLETIFYSAGYSIESDFIAGDMFGSLYMSGNYPRKSVEGDKSKMDFLAGRFTDISAAANSEGKVYAKPLQNTNSIKNIVETADPREERDGVVLEEVFTRNGCFTSIDGRVAFVPTHTVVVGFEFRISFTADYYMASREELKTFDTLYLWSGQERSYKVINRNQDRREEFRSGKTFTAIVFDHEEGDTYQFGYDEITDAQTGASVERIHTIFSSRTQSITVASGEVTNPKLWVRRKASSVFVECEKDWALYDGYVKERGEIEVELTVRSSPERVMPSQPKYFDQIYFGGAEPGMNLTLGKNTTLRPLFAGYPCEGSTVKFEEVAAHEVSCLDLINSLRHIFNLYFYTDNIAKKVLIEPRDRFYRKDVIVDWSRKIDISKPISVSEPGKDMPRIYTLRYQTGDGTVNRWDQANNQRMGSYSWPITNRFAKEGESISLNPLFTASINSEGEYPDAPAASLVQAGDRGADTFSDVEELNFPAKIVRYFGLAALPEAQRWGWPSYRPDYPLIAFHRSGTGSDVNGEASADNGSDGSPQRFSLCFEDRDSVEGMHRYYDTSVALCNESKRVEAYVCMGPEDVEPFIRPNSLKHDFRALYRLEIEGENALYRLLEIVEYNPAEPSVKCVFIKEL